MARPPARPSVPCCSLWRRSRPLKHPPTDSPAFVFEGEVGGRGRAWNSGLGLGLGTGLSLSLGSGLGSGLVSGRRPHRGSDAALEECRESGGLVPSYYVVPDPFGRQYLFGEELAEVRRHLPLPL